MIIQRKVLNEILKIIYPAISYKGILEEYGMFIFTEDMIWGFNGRIGTGHPLKNDLKCLIPSKELFDLVEKFGAEDIHIAKKNDKISLRGEAQGGIIQAEIRTFEDKANILNTIPKQTLIKQWNPLPANFNDAIRMTLFSVAKDISMGALNCIFCQDNFLISSDNFRISKFRMCSTLSNSFLIPLSSAIELSKISNLTDFSFFDGWILFKGQEGIIFFLRGIEHNFPETSNLFQITGKDVIEFPSRMKDFVGACKVFTEAIIKDQKIKVKIENNIIKCRGENMNGWIEHSLEIDCNKSLEFDINPSFFEFILGFTKKAIIGNNRILFQGDNFEHLISLSCYEDNYE